MSSGKFHDRVTFCTIFPATFLFANFSGSLLSTLVFAVGYIFAGFMFGPDLDTKSCQYKRWGALRFIWIPYQKLGGHRSFASQSHDSLFGPTIRLLYLLSLLFLSLMVVSLLFRENLFATVNDHFDRSLLQTSSLFILGSWFGSLSHHLTDWADSLTKVKKSRKKKKKLKVRFW